MADKWIDKIMPKYRLGNIQPRQELGIRRGPNYQLYQLVPPSVMEIMIPLGIGEYTKDAVEAAMPRFWECVESLAAEGAQRIILGGAPISSQLGRARVLKLAAEVKERTGVEMGAPIEAMLAGLEHFGAKKIAIGSRWADELNQAMSRYFEDGGMQVLAVTTRGQWNAEAHRMTFEEGLQTALDVAREAAQIAPEADAIIVPGGAAFSLQAIPAVEEEFGKPTLTNLSAEVWAYLVKPGIVPPVQGWGRLLANQN
jgi:maleate cis-trans isomerase